MAMANDRVICCYAASGEVYGDLLHLTDDPTSGSGPGRAPSPDSPTVVRVNHGSEA